MLSFLWNFVLLVTQHLLLQIVMPTLRKTVEKIVGRSPAQRARDLQAELERIREEGSMVRAMMAQIIEERAAREAELERSRERMRIAGLLSAEELDMMIQAEDRLRRGGMWRDSMGGIVSGSRRIAALPLPNLGGGTLEEMVAEDLGQDRYESMVLGPLQSVDDEIGGGRGNGWWCWLGFIAAVLVIVVVGLAVLVGALTRPHVY